MPHIPHHSFEERFDERYKISEDTYSFDTVNEMFEPDAKELKSFIQSEITRAVEEYKDRVREEIEKIIFIHKEKGCLIANSSEYDEVNMARHVENPLVRALVFQHVDSVRMLKEIPSLQLPESTNTPKE